MGSRQTGLRPGPDALTRPRRPHRLLSSGRSVDAYIGSAALAAGIAEIEALGELLRLACAERDELSAGECAAITKERERMFEERKYMTLQPLRTFTAIELRSRLESASNGLAALSRGASAKLSGRHDTA